MEGFLVYVILCFVTVEGVGGCNDYAPQTVFRFETIQDCTAFAYKALEVGQNGGEKLGMVYVDGKAFCLRFTESRET